jgi:purine nucleoside phosphorylase
MTVEIGIIGGSGLYDMAERADREEVRVETPFGDPSAPYVLGTLRGRRVAFLARHGKDRLLRARSLSENIRVRLIAGSSRPARSAAWRCAGARIVIWTSSGSDVTA